MIGSREYFITVVALGLGFLLLVLLAWLWAHLRRQRMAREVERNEALFDAFFNAAPAGMAILDRELNFVRVNSTLLALMQQTNSLIREGGGMEGGGGAESCARQSLRNLPPDLAAALLPRMTEVLMSNQPVDKMEIVAGAGEGGVDADVAACWLVSLFPIPTSFGRNPVGLGMVIQDIAPLKATQRALEQSRAALRRLGAHRERQMEQEYQRLAREFHDELGQLLTTARMHLQLLSRQPEVTHAQVAASAQTIDGMLAEAYRSIKTIAADLRPPALNLGLVAAIEWLVERMLLPIGVHCEVHCQDADALRGLEDGLAITAFRIVQEALTNVVRHAEARTVRIVIARERIDGAGLHLSIADDGKGFDMTQVSRETHFGLLGMTERVAALGGRLDVETAPGAGTHIEVRLPDASGAFDVSSRGALA
jgi:signal transduction histidine kinase